MPSQDRLETALREIVFNLTDRLHKLETQEQERSSIATDQPSGDLVLTAVDQDIPGLTLSLTQGVYLIQLAIDATIEAGQTMRAGIYLDGVASTLEATTFFQAWRVVVAAYATVIITAYARKSGGAGTSTVFSANTQLVATKVAV